MIQASLFDNLSLLLHLAVYSFVSRIQYMNYLRPSHSAVSDNAFPPKIARKGYLCTKNAFSLPFVSRRDMALSIIICCIYCSFYHSVKSMEKRKNGTEPRKTLHIYRAMHVFRAKNQRSTGESPYSEKARTKLRNVGLYSASIHTTSCGVVHYHHIFHALL